MILNIHILLTVVCVLGVSSVNPGFKARVSLKGFAYANQIALESIAEEANKLKIPDASGSSGKLSYKVYNLHIQNFVKPSSTFNLEPPSYIIWKANNAGIGIKGTLHYTYHIIIPIRDTINFDASAGGISFKTGIALSNGTKGHLHISTSSCEVSIGSVSIKFHGGAAWLYNLFSEIIGSKIKDALQGQFCHIVTNIVNQDAEKQLAKIPVTVVLGKKFLLDYSFISKPDVKTEFMDVFLKGEIYWKTDPKEAPFLPASMPKSSDSSRMLYLWLTPYIANTLGYVAVKHGFMKYNLTAKDLPPGKKSFLNTTCTDFKCIGFLIPQIGKKYPNLWVKLIMYATQTPVMNINSFIGIKFAGNIDLHIDTGKGTGPHLITFNNTVYVDLEASLNGKVVQGKITKYKSMVGIVSSDIGFVDIKVIQLLMDVAAKTFIIPHLNELGEKGLILPLPDNVQLVNSEIKILQDAVMIATDVNYKIKQHLKN